MRADALGRPLRFLITPGQTGDITAAPALPEGQEGRAVLADKACDSNALRAMIADMGAEIVIPSNRSRKVIIPHDPTIRRQRNHIERCFSRLKHFRRFAARYAAIKAGASFGNLASREKTATSRIQQVIGLAFLAPNILDQVAAGCQPVAFTSE